MVYCLITRRADCCGTLVLRQPWFTTLPLFALQAAMAADLLHSLPEDEQLAAWSAAKQRHQALGWFGCSKRAALHVPGSGGSHVQSLPAAHTALAE